MLFRSAESLGESLEVLEEDSQLAGALGAAARERALGHYRWDEVADGYLRLAKDLASGRTTRSPKATRNPQSAWTGEPKQIRGTKNVHVGLESHSVRR